MPITFDPAKNEANLAKHGVALSDFHGFDAAPTVVTDGRYAEPRLRAYGRIGGLGYCLAFAVRGDDMRLISFRRAHEKEMRRYE